MNTSSKEVVELLPPCRLLFRSKEAVEIYELDDVNGTARSTETDKNSRRGCITLVKGSSTMHTFSPDGSMVLIHLPSIGVILRHLAQLDSDHPFDEKPFLENSKGVQYMSFSPKGTYILTWERTHKQQDGMETTQPNLKIWDSSNGKQLYGIQMRNLKKEQWPPLRWTHDEKFAFHMVTNELHVYKGGDFSLEDPARFVDKVRCSGIGGFSLPVRVDDAATVKEKYVICTFYPQHKGKPARVSLLRYPDRCGSTENPASGPILTSKSCFQAEEYTAKWSPKGDAALILTHTNVDTSGESYYGNTMLFLLLSETTKNANEGDCISVPLPAGNAGPVLDASWMPDPTKSSCFAVISGRMPAIASLHHGTTAEPTFIFGNAHRNTIIWSSHGRFITLAGFGNLSGGMDFYDRNKLKPIPQYDMNTGIDLGSRGNSAPCAVGYGWSPSSRYFMVSTTSPRMNVDNGVRLYKYNGLEVRGPLVSWDNTKYLPDKLLAAEFVPALLGVYPDRPQTPPPKRSDGLGTSEGLVELSEPCTPKCNSAPSYVPPAARKSKNVSAGSTLAERMRQEREAKTVQATKVAVGAISTTGRRLPVGMTVSNTEKAKHVVKKDKQRVAKQTTSQVEQIKEENTAQSTDIEANKTVDIEKRSKKLKKILKQIEELQSKDPSTLNEDQIQKIASENDIRQELASLGLDN